MFPEGRQGLMDVQRTVHTGHALLKKKRKDKVKWHLKNVALPESRQLFSM